MECTLNLRIVLEKPPAGIDFALQKGSGNNYDIIQRQRSTEKDLYFECEVRVKNSKDSIITFLGPFAQGPSGGRFIYIDIGTYAGQKDTPWSRRLKIPLTGITWEILQQLPSNTPIIFEARVPGMGKDGSPACATVKPFDGWKLVNV